jgi:hypothetical protein
MRPLARRAFKTFRPLRVAIRARKPWVRARLRRLGWKVRFITDNPEHGAAKAADKGTGKTRDYIFALALGQRRGGEGGCPDPVDKSWEGR